MKPHAWLKSANWNFFTIAERPGARVQPGSPARAAAISVSERGVGLIGRSVEGTPASLLRTPRLAPHETIVPRGLVGRDRRQPPDPLVYRREVRRGVGDQLLEAVDHEVGVLEAVDAVLGA